MKKLILSELLLLFLATTFIGDNPPGWYQQNIPLGNKSITDIQFLDSLNGWVVTNWSPAFDTAYIFKTSDGGNNWSFQSRYPASFTAVNMVNNSTGYASGGDGFGRLFKTTNGGLNWSLIYTAGHLFNDLFFVNKDTGWVCDDDAGFGVGIIKTTNGGINWQQQLGASFTPSRLFFLNQDTGWAVCNSNKLYRTTNSGINWGEIHSFTSTITNFFFAGRDTGYLVGGRPSGPNLLRTTNGGFLWDTVNNSIQFGGGQKLFLLNNTIGWIGSIFNTIVASKDGYNWGSQYSPSYTSYSIHFVDSLKGWAGTSFLVHTTDGGGAINAIQNKSNEVPSDYKLYQNYPNPFNPSTIIKFQIQRLADIRLVIYDVTGKEIITLVNEAQSAGMYEVDFNGSYYSSGVYFYSLIVDGKPVDTKKMLMIK